MPSKVRATKSAQYANATTRLQEFRVDNRRLRASQIFVTAGLLTALLFVFGCQQSAEPHPANDDGDSATQATTSQPTLDSNMADQGHGDEQSTEQNTAQPDKLREAWDAIYMGDAKIGLMHTVFERTEQNGQPMVKVTSLQKLEIERDAQSTTLQTRIVTIETPLGAVRSFTLKNSIGPTPITIQGTYNSSRKVLDIVTNSQGRESKYSTPWDGKRGGFFVFEESLYRHPMKPGEKRKLMMLASGVIGLQEVTASLSAEKIESTTLLEGPRQLLRIALDNQIGDQQFEAVCWMAPDGEVLKMTIPSLLHTVYRTTQARAEAAGTGSYDLFQNSIVKVTPPLPHPHQLTRAEYTISLRKKDPAQIFTSGDSQEVRPIDQRHARVTVLAVRPGSPVTGIKAPPPGPDDSAANNLIQSDDARIVEMARQLVGSATDPWEKCRLLEKGVHAAIQAKNYGQGFATAADVVRTLEGDCTEHAVLLAALCRAESIPTRVALGLVYSSRQQGFAFHMWNEAWVGDRWIPLDATLGLGGIGAAHLKLTHSSLARQAAESAILSVVQVINQLRIEVLEFEPK